MAAYAVSAVLRSLAEAAMAARQAQRAGSWELVGIINDGRVLDRMRLPPPQLCYLWPRKKAGDKQCDFNGSYL